MTVHQLRPSQISTHIAAARAGIEAALEVPLESVDRFELGHLVSELVALEAQVASLKHDGLAEADRRDVADVEGDTGTDAWAARLTGTTRAVMAGGIRLAKLLREKYAATRTAFASGRICEEQVRVIVNAAERLPGHITSEQRAQAEEDLVEKAIEGANARQLRHAARRMADAFDKQLADQHEKEQLEDEEESAELETWMSLHNNGDGTVSGRFVIPELQGEMLKSALERLTSPRRWGRNKAGELVEDHTIPGMGPGLSFTERLGAGLCELIEHLPTEGHSKVAATLMVHIKHEHLLNGLASARLDSGTRISVREALRLSCGAGIMPAVLNGKEEPLYLGRKKRLHTEGQRAALSIKHDSCAAEGCERPFAWCEIHHPEAWSRGGRTDLDNAIPLCGHHHRRAHDDRYRVKYLPTGEVRFRLRRVSRSPWPDRSGGSPLKGTPGVTVIEPRRTGEPVGVR